MAKRSKKTPRTIWIARHAQRLDEVEPGWRTRADRPYDSPLSDEGVVQARALARRLAAEPIRHVIASPMLRTVATADAVAESRNLPIRLEEGIFEWLTTRWFDRQPVRLTNAELEARFPRVDREHRSLGTFPLFPESREQRDARAADVVRRILETHDGDLLLVTHAALLVVLARVFAGRDIWIGTDNSALVKIVGEGDGTGWRLELAGDTSHIVLHGDDGPDDPPR